MSALEHLWAGWRHAYVTRAGAGDFESADKIFSNLSASEHADNETFIVHRGKHCFAILNIYPYTSGHLLILPYRVVGELEDLSDEEFDELFKIVKSAVSALKSAYSPAGINIGTNLGRAAGAGIPEHLHIHCLPRFDGDTNFMTTVANTKVLPEALDETWRKIKDAWPT